MEQYIEEMINYYRDLGFSEEKLNRLRKLIEEEFKTIEITVANPKGIWPIIDEEPK